MRRRDWMMAVGGGPLLALIRPDDERTVPARPTADDEESRAIRKTLADLYAVISGPAGQKRDWKRMRGLFVKGARLVPIGPLMNGERAFQLWSVDDYVKGAGPVLERDGFFETEVACRLERYGALAHAFSTYESRRKPEEKPFQRGINSIQLVRDAERWRVLQVAWVPESPSEAIPARYLPA